MVTIESVNVSKSLNGLSNVVKSINWNYTYNKCTISGTQEVAEPNPIEFTPLKELTNEIVKGWLENLIDFSQYNEFMVKPIEQEETINIQL
jgi:hypothetical protein